ncbi:MAG TPA: hypothetical protein VEI06_02025 [Gemmatimonadaceae bacterium]|nr:hypothetical protein [Gemmatimonadaceae bacterium]
MSASHPMRAMVASVALACAACASPSAPIDGSQLVILTQPAGAAAGSALRTEPVVALADGSGRVLVDAEADVSVELVGSGALSGTLVVHAVHGVAHFTDLRIDATGVTALRFTSPGYFWTISSLIRQNIPGPPIPL